MICSYLFYVAHCLQPFFVVYFADVRVQISYRSVLVNTFKQYMTTLANIVKQNTSSCLPDLFAIMFDSHIAPEAHHATFLATDPPQTTLSDSFVCLAT